MRVPDSEGHEADHRAVIALYIGVPCPTIYKNRHMGRFDMAFQRHFLSAGSRPSSDVDHPDGKRRDLGQFCAIPCIVMNGRPVNINLYSLAVDAQSRHRGFEFGADAAAIS